MTRRKPLGLLSIAFAVSLITADLPAAESDSRLTNKLEAALNQQVNAELASSYLYLSMVAYFEDVDLCAALRNRGGSRYQKEKFASHFVPPATTRQK